VYIAYFVFRTARERCHTQYALRNANNPYSSADTSLSTATAASATSRPLREDIMSISSKTKKRRKIRDKAKKIGAPLCVNQAGSLFAVFFGSESVDSFEEVKQSDTGRYGKFFHAALERGVYLPPSAYETCFISTAHVDQILDRAINILEESLQEAFG